jgi:choice-of-anchor A domain-containing protein
MRILGNVVLTLLFGALGAVSAPAQSYILNELGPAGPTGFVSAFGSPGFAILGRPGATDTHLNGPGTTIGNVGISAGTLSLDSSNPFAIKGNLYLASGATATHIPQQVNGSIFTGQDALLNTADSSALSAISTFSSLAPTITGITSINGTETINPSPGANGVTVLDLKGINLGGNDVLTLTGPSTAQYVLNVTGDITLNSGKILLSGGLTPQDVVINDIGKNSIHTSGGLGNESIITGLLLAPNASIGFSPGLVNGEVIFGTPGAQWASGASVVSPVPESSSLGLMAAVGIAVVGRCVMRRRQHA